MSSPNSSLKKPSSISKLALLRSKRFIAQSKVISFRGEGVLMAWHGISELRKSAVRLIERSSVQDFSLSEEVTEMPR